MTASIGFGGVDGGAVGKLRHSGIGVDLSRKVFRSITWCLAVSFSCGCGFFF